MIAIFGPSNRKENPHLSPRCCSQHMVKHLRSVGLNHPNISDICRNCTIQKFGQSWPIYFNSQKIGPRMGYSTGKGRFAMPNTDVYTQWSILAPDLCSIYFRLVCYRYLDMPSRS